MPGAITNITVGPGGGGDVTPTEVSPVVVYAPVTYSGGRGFGATVTSYSAGAYACPRGHQMANYTSQAFFDNGGQQYTVLNPATGQYEATPQYYTAFDASQYKTMNESWANTVGKMVSSFDGMGWYHAGGTNVPAYGYWHF